MRRLVCACVVRKPRRQVFSRRGPYKEGIYNLSVIAPMVFGFCVVSSLAIILQRKRELFSLFYLCCGCLWSVPLTHGVVCWSAVCNCGIASPYLLFHCQHKCICWYHMLFIRTVSEIGFLCSGCLWVMSPFLCFILVC